MAGEAGQSVLARVAEQSRQALGPNDSVRTIEFLAACSQVLPVIGVSSKRTRYMSPTNKTAYTPPPHPSGLPSAFLCPPRWLQRDVCMKRAVRSRRPDQLGAAFMMVRSDIHGNVSRLEQRAETDRARFADVFAIVNDEVARGVEGDSRSATKGLLWLKRCGVDGHS